MDKNELRNLVETVKQKTDIVGVIGRKVDLNGNMKGRCPFHDDKTPSFSVNPHGQYFNCFGCDVGGDVIRFLELFEKKRFWQVLTQLAREAGVALPERETVDERVLEAERRVEEIMDRTAQYYHEHLTDEIRSYLNDKRGFSDESITRFRIGYANGDLQRHLVDTAGFSEDLCIKSGVLKKMPDGRVVDHFRERIIFPNRKHGRVVHLTGRIANDGDPKYLHLPGPITHLFNEDAPRDSVWW